MKCFLNMNSSGTSTPMEIDSSESKPPPEVLDVILTCLPFKDFVKSRMVCKTWKELIDRTGVRTAYLEKRNLLLTDNWTMQIKTPKLLADLKSMHAYATVVRYGRIMTDFLNRDMAHDGLLTDLELDSPFWCYQPVLMLEEQENEILDEFYKHYDASTIYEIDPINNSMIIRQHILNTDAMRRGCCHSNVAEEMQIFEERGFIGEDEWNYGNRFPLQLYIPVEHQGYNKFKQEFIQKNPDRKSLFVEEDDGSPEDNVLIECLFEMLKFDLISPKNKETCLEWTDTIFNVEEMLRQLFPSLFKCPLGKEYALQLWHSCESQLSGNF
jgi:F-box domain